MKTEISKGQIRYYLNGNRTPDYEIGKRYPVARPVLIECYIHTDTNNKNHIRVTGGVTGYESWYLSSILKNHDKNDPEDFVVCAGTPGRWARLTINKDEWNEFIDIITAHRNPYREIDDLQLKNKKMRECLESSATDTELWREMNDECLKEVGDGIN